MLQTEKLNPYEIHMYQAWTCLSLYCGVLFQAQACVCKNLRRTDSLYITVLLCQTCSVAVYRLCALLQLQM